jgi:hypothetical protein
VTWLAALQRMFVVLIGGQTKAHHKVEFRDVSNGSIVRTTKLNLKDVDNTDIIQKVVRLPAVSHLVFVSTNGFLWLLELPSMRCVRHKLPICEIYDLVAVGNDFAICSTGLTALFSIDGSKKWVIEATERVADVFYARKTNVLVISGYRHVTYIKDPCNFVEENVTERAMDQRAFSHSKGVVCGDLYAILRSNNVVFVHCDSLQVVGEVSLAEKECRVTFSLFACLNLLFVAVFDKDIVIVDPKSFSIQGKLEGSRFHRYGKFSKFLMCMRQHPCVLTGDLSLKDFESGATVWNVIMEIVGDCMVALNE